MISRLRRIPAVLPETTTFLNTIIGAGGTISAESLQAADRFIRDCKNASIWDKLLEVYPLIGNSLIAALVKLKYTSTGTMTAVNFGGADYTERGSNGGIIGDGATKYINTNFAQSGIPAAAFISAYVRTPGTGGPYYWMAVNTGTDWASLGSPTGVDQRVLLGGSGISADLPSNNAGLVYGDRSSSTNLQLQTNNGTPATAAGATTPNYGARNMYLFARNNNDIAPTQWTNGRCSFFAIGISMTAAERTAFYNAVQAFQTNFQRNV